MASYLSVEEFKKRALIPRSYVDAVELLEAGFTLTALEYWSTWIEARLRKSYKPPYNGPQLNMIKGWLARIVAIRVLLRRGIDPQDEQNEQIRKDAEDALLEVKEAANGENSLFDLGDNDGDDSTQSGAGGPRVYSEQSPYVSADIQAQIGRQEDDARYGSIK